MTDLIPQIQNLLLDPDRIPTAILSILLAIVIGAITGPAHGNANPALWLTLDRFFGALGDKMNKPGRPKGDLIFRGLVLAIGVMLFSFAFGLGLKNMAQSYPHYNALETLFLTFTITLGSVWFAGLRLYFALANKETHLEGAYFNIARTNRANLNASDDFGITRLCIGMLAKTFDKGLVAPVFWYLMAGLPAATLYAAMAMLSWRFAKDGQDRAFAATIVALEKLMGFVPSAFAALLLSLASAISPTATIGKSIQSWFGLKDRARYAQGGWPLSVMAWTLRLSLGGPHQDTDGHPVKAPWVGPKGASAKNDYKHLRRALILHSVAALLFIVTLASTYIWASL